MDSKLELVVGVGTGSVTGKWDASESTEVDFSAIEGILKS